MLHCYQGFIGFGRARFSLFATSAPSLCTFLLCPLPAMSGHIKNGRIKAHCKVENLTCPRTRSSVMIRRTSEPVTTSASLVMCMLSLACARGEPFVVHVISQVACMQASEMTIKPPPPRILLGDAAKPSSSQPDAGQTSVKVPR